MDKLEEYKLLEEDKRRNIRLKIKSEAKNLCSQVVNTSIEYKEELLQLEKDNNKLRKENEYLSTIKINLETQKEMLSEEIKEKNKRIKNLIKCIAPEQICFNCQHSLNCEFHLCVYCQNRVCGCCIYFCEANNNCSVIICSLCDKDFDNCPKHTDIFTEEKKQELISFYEINRFKKY